MVKLGRKEQLVIPKEIQEALGLKEGDRLLVGVEGGRVVLTAPGEYARRTCGEYGPGRLKNTSKRSGLLGKRPE